MASKVQKNRGRFYPVPIDDYGRICVTFEIPNHTYYKAAVRGVLHDLESSSSWHYTRNPGDTNASQVAQIFRQLLFETYRYSNAPCRTNCPDPEPCDCEDCEDCDDYIEDEFDLDEDEIHMLLDCYKHSVGDIKMSATSNVSGGWLLCDGAFYPKMQYPELAAALEGLTPSDETEFAVPDFSLRSPMGTGYSDDFMALQPLGTAGALKHELTEDEMPEHAHSAGSHTHNVPAHSHGIGAHTHEVGGHSHDIPPHTHTLSSSTHSHAMNDVEIPTRSNSAIGSGARLVRSSGAGTADTLSVPQPNTGDRTLSINSQPLVTSNNMPFNTGASSGSTDNSAVLETLEASGTSGSAGGGEAHNIVHPVLGVLFYIFAGCAISGEDCQ